MLLLVMLARAAFLIPITMLANTWRRSRIEWREVVAMWWAGEGGGGCVVLCCAVYGVLWCAVYGVLCMVCSMNNIPSCT